MVMMMMMKMSTLPYVELTGAELMRFNTVGLIA